MVQSKYNPEDRLKEIVPLIAERSGLFEDTVEDLLRKGWTYKNKIDEADCWVKEF